jgi:hypothetical protein
LDDLLQILESLCGTPDHPRTDVENMDLEEQCERIQDDIVYTKWAKLEAHDKLPDQSEDLRLWVSAGTRADRTGLAVHALHQLQDNVVSGDNEYKAVLFFHSKQLDNGRNTASAIFRAWLYQLVQQRPDLSRALRYAFQTTLAATSICTTSIVFSSSFGLPYGVEGLGQRTVLLMALMKASMNMPPRWHNCSLSTFHVRDAKATTPP